MVSQRLRNSRRTQLVPRSTLWYIRMMLALSSDSIFSCDVREVACVNLNLIADTEEPSGMSRRPLLKVLGGLIALSFRHRPWSRSQLF